MRLWPWAIIAVAVPVLGGRYLSLAGARPDVILAFAVASAGKRHSARFIVPVLLFLCVARTVLSPPEACGESLGLLVLSGCLLCAAWRWPQRGAPALLLRTTAAFWGLVVFTAIWQKGTGGTAGLLPLGQLARAFLLTAAFACAFAAVLPEGRKGG